MREREHARRFWAKVKKTDGCWLWTGHAEKPPTGFGYGLLSRRIGGKLVNLRAHRIAYELTRGPIPDGMCVRHSCDNPRCVNPDHLCLGSQADNIRDMDSRGRRRSRPRAAACPKGHAYDQQNTRLYRGQQVCRACDRDRGRYGVDR